MTIPPPRDWTPDQKLAVLGALFTMGALATAGGVRTALIGGAVGAALLAAFNDDEPVPVIADAAPASPGTALHAARMKALKEGVESGRITTLAQAAAVSPEFKAGARAGIGAAARLALANAGIPR